MSVVLRRKLKTTSASVSVCRNHNYVGSTEKPDFQQDILSRHSELRVDRRLSLEGSVLLEPVDVPLRDVLVVVRFLLGPAPGTETSPNQGSRAPAIFFLSDFANLYKILAKKFEKYNATCIQEHSQTSGFFLISRDSAKFCDGHKRPRSLNYAAKCTKSLTYAASPPPK